MHLPLPRFVVLAIWLLACQVAYAQPPLDVEAETSDGTSTVSDAAVPRVRLVGSPLARVVRDATVRSTTFRQLVDAIGGTDGIVYVQHGDCGHGVRACVMGVIAAGAQRIVMVRVDEHKADWDLMGSIGHELQHAMEVLANPSITSTLAMHAFYRREGRRIGRVFETAAAVRIGNEVRSEARRQGF
jgi:hypothetical protein